MIYRYVYPFLALSLIGTSAISAPAEPAKTSADALTGFVELELRESMLGAITVDDQGARQDSDSWLGTQLRLGAKYAFTNAISISAEGELRTDRIGGSGTSFGQTVGDDTFNIRRDADGPKVRLLPRNLYLRAVTPIGLFKCGHQAAHWGTGFLVNDGRNDRAFVQLKDGNLVERCLAAGKIGDAFTFFVAGDYVYRDDNAVWAEGDRAYGWTAGARYTFDTPKKGPNENVIGILFAQRFQTDRLDPRHPAGEKTDLEVNTIDAHLKWRFALDGGAFIRLEAEGALIFGETTRPYLDETYENGADIFALGGLGRLEYVTEPFDASLEVGYAAGDNDPQDDRITQFTFNTAHTVGLVLFEHVLPLVTARSADRLMDPALIAVAPSGTRFTVNQGTVRNAFYVNPIVRWRPSASWQLTVGYLFAQRPTDSADIFQSAINGGYNTTVGGQQPGERTLGQEVDLGVAYEMSWDRLKAVVGLEVGQFVPGNALNGVLDDPIYVGRSFLSVRW